MRVRMLTTVAGADFVHESGEEYDLPDDVARDYCARPSDMPRAEPVAVKQVERAERRPRQRGEMREQG